MLLVTCLSLKLKDQIWQSPVSLLAIKKDTLILGDLAVSTELLYLGVIEISIVLPDVLIECLTTERRIADRAMYLFSLMS